MVNFLPYHTRSIRPYAVTVRRAALDIITVYMHEHVIGGSTDICMVMAMRVISAVMVVVVVVRHIYAEQESQWPSIN